MRPNKLVFVTICFAAAYLIAAAPAFSASEGGVKIAVVDMQRAMSESKAGGQAQKDYEREVKRAQAELDSKKEQLQKMSKEITVKGDSLNEKARSQKEEELISQEKSLKRTLEDSKEALRRKNSELVMGLVKELRKVIAEIGEKDGYTLILEKGSPGVLFSDKAVDITEKVIKEFDSK